MTWLIDTHLLLWAAIGSRRLPRAARRILDDPSAQLLFSSASMWEVAIKANRSENGFDVDVARLRRGLLENDYAELAITGEHTVMTRTLPRVHADPFDRMLLAQAIAEDVTLLTADPVFADYEGPVEIVRPSR